MRSGVTQLRASFLAITLLATVSSHASAQGLPPLAHMTVGSEFRYTVKASESLVSIGARNGIESVTLATMNGLKPKTPLKPGQVLDIDNRHIVPADLPDGILINLPQRKLFLLNDGRVAGNYPIGPGKAAFATPIGGFSVIQMPNAREPDLVCAQINPGRMGARRQGSQKDSTARPWQSIGRLLDGTKFSVVRDSRYECSTLDL